MAATGGAGTSIGSFPSANLHTAPATTPMSFGTKTMAPFTLPKMFEPSPPEKTVELVSIPGTSITEERHLFFRDVNKVMPLLLSNKDFVVYYITAHGTLLSEPFTPPMLGRNRDGAGLPYCVVQTGGGDAVGCPFYYKGNELIKNLFSYNIAYSFQHLLGLQADSIPSVYKDLHYSTNDYAIRNDGKTTTEKIPNKNLSFSIKESKLFGVYKFDPNEFKMGVMSDMFVKLHDFDKYFTRGYTDDIISMFNTNTGPKGITLDKLLPLIITSSGLNMRPSIFIVYSCADTDAKSIASAGDIIRHVAQATFYQYRKLNSPYPYIEPKGNLPKGVIEDIHAVYPNYRGKPSNVYVKKFFEEKIPGVNRLLFPTNERGSVTPTAYEMSLLKVPTGPKKLSPVVLTNGTIRGSFLRSNTTKPTTPTIIIDRGIIYKKRGGTRKRKRRVQYRKTASKKSDTP